MRVDSIAKTLAEAVKADKNVKVMSLYSPNGTSFGHFSAERMDFDETKIRLPDDLNTMREEPDVIHFYSKVISSHPKCCQCDVSGASKNGEYYYVLESSVSKSELNAVQARMGLLAALLAAGNLLASFLIAKVLSRRLVKNIRTAVHRVRAIKQNGNLSERIGLQGPDEVAFLTREFDHLLDSLESSQKRLVEAEKAQSKVQLARVVAHNIRSPIVAIEMMIPQMLSIPDRTRRILTNSVKEIKQLAEKLRNKPEEVVIQPSGLSQMDELVFLPILLEDVVGQKQIEYSQRSLEIVLNKEARTAATFANVNSAELRSILSNLINNAVEAYGGGSGRIEVALNSSDRCLTITIQDYGCGIPAEYLQELGRRQITFKGGSGRGLGLMHAVQMIESWGGSININSEVGVGTKITIQLKRFECKQTTTSTVASL